MRKTRLNPISKSPHRLKLRFWPKDVLKAVKARSGCICERIMPDGSRCNEPAMSQPDHILARSQAPSHFKNTFENARDLGFKCHSWKGDHPKEAVEQGLTLPYYGYKPEKPTLNPLPKTYES